MNRDTTSLRAWKSCVGTSAGALAIISLACGTTAGAAQQELTSNVTRDPAAAVFVYTDLENFIRVQKTIDAGADPAEALQTQYFDQASLGLLLFIEKYDLTLERLLDAMAKRPAEYRRIDELLNALEDQEPSFRQTYAAIQRVIPDAVFPPIYFVVSGYKGIGSGSIEGPLISIEKKTATSIKEGDVEPTLVHEMIHIQQLAAVGEEYFAIFLGEERTLLALSIREGASTFFAELITGGSEHKNLARDYYLAHENELWEAFSADMLGHEMAEWLWEKPADPDKPQDLGYAIGARIVEVFYDNAVDKGAAAREIMAITDYPAFLARTGYAVSSRAAVAQQMSREHEVRAAVSAFGRAFAEADASVLKSLLTKDYVHVNGGSGSVLSRNEWLDWVVSRRAQLNSGELVVSVYSIEDVRVQIYGEAAVVTGVVHSSGRRNNALFASRVRFTNVWVNQRGVWLRVAFHDSLLAKSGS